MRFVRDVQPLGRRFRCRRRRETFRCASSTPKCTPTTKRRLSERRWKSPCNTAFFIDGGSSQSGEVNGTSSSQMGGSWSSDGCKVQKQYESDGTVVCQCDHLTHFTVIPGEAISQPSAQLDFTKKLAVYVGCAIAAVFLSISLFIFICFKRIRSKLAVAHANLCLCLLTCNVLFAISINGTSSQAVCRGIAISFHLFVLPAFLWLVGEAVELCHAAVGRMGTCFDVHRLKLVLPLLWGIVIIYVGLWSYFVYDSYGCNAGFCFLSIDYAWIVTGPTAGLSFVAFFIWLIAACACCRTREESQMRPWLMLKKTGLILATQTLAWISANTAIEGVLVFAFLCVLDNAINKIPKHTNCSIYG
ncbi:adhesion G protein-coupled receptor L4-like [Oscarella lobularis]|uniref:adhesion G protein-coupled receptor L4-like n=1 Tax=Oscarella lobularis TaxID=121494 RepID=UPI0033136DE5